MLHVLYVTCAIVGAIVLYCAVMAALWATAVRLVRRRATRLAQAARVAQMSGTAGAAIEVPQDTAGDDRRARSWQDLPGWLWRDRPWAVAVVLLGAPSIRERTGVFVDFPARVIDWPGLLAASATWPRDQRLLVMSAHELAFDSAGDAELPGEPPVTLQDVAELLDDDEVQRIQLAVEVHRGRMQLTEALTRLG